VTLDRSAVGQKVKGFSHTLGLVSHARQIGGSLALPPFILGQPAVFLDIFGHWFAPVLGLSAIASDGLAPGA
jgi:hypothetical protein